MTKDERTIHETREEDGEQVEYICSPVKHGGKQVGFAPRRETKDLDEMLGVLEPEKIHSLADRQLDQDMKNAVRAKFTKDTFKASSFGKAISNGEIDPKGLAEVTRIAEQKAITIIAAGAIFLGLGKDAKVEPEKIHWDILPTVKVAEPQEVEEDSEVEESEE